jgi:hypothetical protein
VRPNKSKSRRHEGNLRQRFQRGVLHFVLVARRGRKVRQQVTALCVHARAVVVVSEREREIAEFCGGDGIGAGRILWTEREGIRGVKALHRIGNEFVVVGFGSGHLVMPMLPCSEIPPRARAEKMIVGVRIEVRRLQQRLPRSLRAAGIVS